eukprot:jgi/Bigna1/71573/fgenesh1_pg.16_\
MPSEKEVQAAFEEYLEANRGLYKKEAEDNMRKILPAKQKWQMVCEAKNEKPEEMRAEVGEYIAMLRESANPNPKMLRDLRAVLRSRDKRWMNLWFEMGGARDVATVLQLCAVRQVQVEAVETLYKRTTETHLFFVVLRFFLFYNHPVAVRAGRIKENIASVGFCSSEHISRHVLAARRCCRALKLINIRLGMEYFCKGDKLHTLTSMVLSLPKLSNKASIMALKLLCAVAEEHPMAIDEVFRKVFRSKPRFWILSDLVENSLDCGVKLWCVGVVLDKLNSKLKRLFLDQNIEVVLDKMDIAAVEKEELEISAPLKNQIALFHEAHKEDRLETTRLQTDLSDPIDVMRAREITEKKRDDDDDDDDDDDGDGDSDKGDGEVVWQRLDWFLHRLTKRTREKMEGKESKQGLDFLQMSYKELGEKIELQASQDVKWKSNELRRLHDQINELEEKLANAPSSSSSLQHHQSLVPPPPGAAGGGGAAGPGIPPPPSAAGMSSGIPPPPGGLGGIPPPPGGLGGLPPPPSMGGVPRAAAAPPKKPQCPAKKKLKPHAKMKPLHWAKLTNEAAYDTVWKELGSDDDALLDGLDLIFIEESFGETDKSKKKKKKGDDDNSTRDKRSPSSSSSSSSSKKKKAKKVAVELVDSKRRQAVDIALKGVKLSGEQAKAAMLQMDTKALPPEKLSLLMKACPTSADMDLLKTSSSSNTIHWPHHRAGRRGTVYEGGVHRSESTASTAAVGVQDPIRRAIRENPRR